MAFALPKNIAKMKRDMAKYRVEYDEWFSETTLHESGAIRDVIEALQKNGLDEDICSRIEAAAAEVASSLKS